MARAGHLEIPFSKCPCICGCCAANPICLHVADHEGSFSWSKQMTSRTGRKTQASEAVKERAKTIKKSNPGLSNKQIADRLGVSTRQVQYWLAQSGLNRKED